MTILPSKSMIVPTVLVTLLTLFLVNKVPQVKRLVGG